MALKDERVHALLHRAAGEVMVVFAGDEVKELEVVEPEGVFVPHGRRHVAVDDAQVARPGVGEEAPGELGAGRRAQVDRRVAVVDGLAAVRHADLAAEPAHDVRHGGRHDGGDLLLIGDAELVGEEDRVDAAVLQRREVGARGVDDALQPAAGVVIGVARQGLEVHESDNGPLRAEEIFHERHGSSCVSWPVCRTRRQATQRIASYNTS